jgi:hypothetical protein
MSSANISDPQIIRDFRARMTTFMEICESALSGSASELSRVRDWLRADQQSFWKKQVIKREEVYQTARRLWLEAEGDASGGINKRAPAKPSSMEERITMDRARRHRDEAEEKLTLVRRWLLRLDQDGEPLVHQCQSHDLSLRDQCRHAIAQLDRLADQVHAYLDLPATTGNAGLPTSAATESAQAAAGTDFSPPIAPPAPPATVDAPKPEVHHA